MAKKVSMQDIADFLHISRMTVSKAFQDGSDISDDMKKKVRITAEQMGYTYKGSAPDELLVLVPEIFLSKTDDFYSTLYKRIAESAAAKNIRSCLYVVNSDDEVNKKITFSTIKKSGIIMMGQFKRRYAFKVKELGLPTVCIDFYYDDLKLDSIVSNNFNAGYIAARYLINKGHKKIFFAGTIKATNSITDRYLGFYKAMQEYDLPCDKSSVINDRGLAGEMVDFQIGPDLPTAFLCNNDYTAYILIEKLDAMGIKVPEDISVIGFDDVIYSKIANPKITTMRVSRTDMAEQSLELMVRRIKYKDAKLINMTLECTMIERESVSSPPNIE